MHTVFTGNPQNLQKVPKIGVPPLFDHFFRKFPHRWTTLSPIQPQKCGFIPLRMTPRGKTLHFWGWIGDRVVQRCGNFLKKWSQREYPYFEHFLEILGISSENGVPDWPPRGCRPAEKTVQHPSGVISEALPRVYLCPRHAGSAKYTLGSTSEMTPKGVVPFSLLACILWETSLAHRFHWKSPKLPKSAQNRSKHPQIRAAP